MGRLGVNTMDHGGVLQGEIPYCMIEIGQNQNTEGQPALRLGTGNLLANGGHGRKMMKGNVDLYFPILIQRRLSNKTHILPR